MSEENKQAGIGRVMTLLAWIVFLGLITWLFSRTLDQRSHPNQSLEDSQLQTITLQRNAAGHYVTPGKINGQAVQFLIDTGATTVAIPANVAARLNLAAGTGAYASTANGLTKTIRTRANSVSVAGIVLHDVAVSVLPNAVGDEVLLGMSFLKHLRISQYQGALSLSK